MDGVYEDVLMRITKGQLRVAFVYDASLNEPMGIEYLSAMVKSNIPEVKVKYFDPKFSRRERIQEFAPHVILYSIMSVQYSSALKRNNYLKKILPPFISIFGGPHPTYSPEMIENDGVDMICRGEADNSIVELLKTVINRENIDSVPGFWSKHNGDIIKNEVGELVLDLDSLPFPDRDLVYDEVPILKLDSKKALISGRGCPFNCTYCHNGSFKKLYKRFGNLIRNRSPQQVFLEAKTLKNNYGAKLIMFNQDVFAGINKEWLKEFTELYTPLDLPYWISLRAEFINEEMVKMLKKSGCVSVGLAIETANEEYRKKYLSRNMSNEKLYMATRMLTEKGISVGAPVIIGLPFTSINDDLDTLDFVCKAKPTRANTCVFQPYEKLPLTDTCIERKILDPNDISTADFYTVAPLRGIDYKNVIKLHNSFEVLILLNNIFGVNVRKLFFVMPDIFIVKWLNIFLKYIGFNKVIKYKRGVRGRIRETLVALTEGTYGFRLFRRKYHF